MDYGLEAFVKDDIDSDDDDDGLDLLDELLVMIDYTRAPVVRYYYHYKWLVL